MAKILQVCNTDFYLNRFLKPLVESLLQAGHEVHTACHTTSQFNALEDARITHHPVAFPASASPLGFLRAIGKLTRIIRAGGYDCVNSHNRNASLAARIAAWRCGVPVNLYTAHGFYFHDDQKPPAHWLTVQLERALAKITDHTLSQSLEDMQFMLGKGYLAQGTIDWIGNGIDTQRFQPIKDATAKTALRQKLQLPANAWLVAAVGRLVRGKGFQDLIAAFADFHARHQASHLLLIGGNIAQDIEPFAAEIRQQIEALGIQDAVTITGLVSNVPEYLAASDAYVLPSYREGLSRAMLEAMSCQLPVIATQIRGCREVIEPGVTGLLYPPHDTTGLTEQLEILYTQPQLARRMGLAAGQLVRKKYDESHYLQRQLRAFEQLLETP
jgi:glycosyltransferase involved in cell wall biosynthesis